MTSVSKLTFNRYLTLPCTDQRIRLLVPPAMIQFKIPTQLLLCSYWLQGSKKHKNVGDEVRVAVEEDNSSSFHNPYTTHLHVPFHILCMTNEKHLHILNTLIRYTRSHPALVVPRPNIDFDIWRAIDKSDLKDF